MTPVETLILVLYFFVLSILAIYGWHRYYLVYLYTKNKDKAPVIPPVLETLPRAWSISANGEVPWVVETVWLESTIVRLETRPALVEPPNKIEPFYGGSHQMFETFRTQVLAATCKSCHFGLD